MEMIKIAYRYLKRYPVIAFSALGLIITASLFEGASFGMLIPLIQSMTKTSAGALQNLPFIKGMNLPIDISDQKSALSIVFMVLFAIIVAKNIFTYLSNIVIAKLRFGFVRDLSTSLMERLIRYDMLFFDRTRTGHLISNITSETTRMGDFMLSALNFIALASRVLAYVVLLFIISWRASLIIFALIVVVLLPLELVMKRLKRLGSGISRALSEYNFKLTEILNGIRLIKQSGTEQEETASFSSAVNNIFAYNYKANRYIHLLIPVSEVSVFGLIVLGFLALVNIWNIDISTAFPFIATYMVVLVKGLTQINLLNTYRSRAINSLAAFRSYEELYNSAGKMDVKSGKKKIGTFSRSIDFKDVGFSYVEGKSVLDGVNAVIPHGKITAIVGASGAGKTTFVNLVMRFYDAITGSIMVDGFDIKDLDLKDWRNRIGFVSQDIFIFNTTARDNIAYGNQDVSQEKVVEAARASGAHDFISSLPNGYDTILGERGLSLSGGQKQRISIARSIIHNPEILILDEATSSLDTETERQIKRAIDELTRHRTVVAIAHRLSTIVNADNIIVLHEGKVAENGHHVQLLEKSGLYRQLYESQFITHSVK